MTSHPKAAIVGLGITEVGKVYGTSARQFGARAVRLAAEDAGMPVGEIDGLLVSGGIGEPMGIDLQDQLGLVGLKLLTSMQAFGSTAAQMVQYAAMAIENGMAEAVAVVWADDPLTENAAAGSAYGAHGQRDASGWRALTRTSGALTPNNLYALAARRHFDAFGTTSEQLGAIAVAQRAWAVKNPLAQMRTPLTLADHQASRMVSDPFHLLDCCLVSNGGIAVIVTSVEKAMSLAQPPVAVLGWAQAHPGSRGMRSEQFGLVTGAAVAGPAALRMADVALDEIDIVELYDCYTYTAMITLEDYGFCKKGEGGPFVAQPGVLGPGGSLKVNTGGGQLSSYYLWGMTPLSEAIIQTRGQAGERQVERHDRVLVSGNGGILDYHATLVLGTL